MRRRLLASTIVVAAVAVVLLGLPFGYFASRALRDEAAQRLAATAQRLADLVAAAEPGAPDPDAVGRIIGSRRHAIVTGPRGQVVEYGASGTVALRATVATDDGGTVTVAIVGSELTQRVVRLWLLVGLASGISLAAAVASGVVVSRRITGPLDALSEQARRLGEGETRLAAPDSGIPEIDRVGAVLRTSGRQIGELLEHEREFATEASHQLRTPLTALSIRLDELTVATDLKDVRAEAEAALAQAERLTGVVETLLDRARQTRAGVVAPTDVPALVRDHLGEWAPAFRRVGRRLVADLPARASAAVGRGTLGQVLDVLLDNALVHGAGQVTVRVRPAADHVVLEVSDHGDGVPAELGNRVFDRGVSGRGGTGIGLALARSLVAREGGRLELVRNPPAVFAAFLPVPDGSSGPAASPVSGRP